MTEPQKKVLWYCPACKTTVTTYLALKETPEHWCHGVRPVAFKPLQPLP